MDRKVILLCACAIPLGLAGGYAWSAFTAPPPHAAKPPKATFGDIPESPEALPTVEDKQWSEEANEQGVYYAGCNEVRAAGKAPLYAGQPGYREGMDGDLDGIACEPHPGS